MWIVTAVDIGETCDHKARVLGIFKSEEDAIKYVRDDIGDYYKRFSEIYGGAIHIHDCKMYVYNEDYTQGCEWNIEEVKLTINDITSEDKIKKSEQVLIDNGIESDEAGIVLQAIGYTLVDIELYPNKNEEKQNGLHNTI